MILVLDTTAYRANSPAGLRFSVLSRLCTNGLVQLKIPFVVEQETLTQRKKTAADLFAQAHRSVNKLSRSSALRSVEQNRLENMVSQVNNLMSAVVPSRTEEDWNHWKDSVMAEVLSLDAEESRNALAAYFEGSAPLTTPKNREDIPDSFIYQQIVRLSRRSEQIAAISNDDKMYSALSQIENLTTFRTLPEFLGSDFASDLISTLEERELLRDLTSFLQANVSSLDSEIQTNGGDEICGVGLPFDDPQSNPSEHTISSYHVPSEITFSFDDLTSYGDGEFSLPFTFEDDVLVTFFIDKHEYWAMEDAEVISVSPWNDYVFEAEESTRVHVEGILRIIAPIEDDTPISSLNYGDFEIAIDSITDITPMGE